MSIRHRMEKRQEGTKLERQDWIRAGLGVLRESGVDAVKVEPLAKLINVTKGSFYWHFQNRDDLLAAILQEWVKNETNNLIEQVEMRGGDAAQKLLNLFELAIEIDGKLENAVRAWATKDTKVAEVMVMVDQNRLDYTQKLFMEVGFSASAAKVRAQMAYYSLVGEFTVGMRPNQAERLAEVRLEYAILAKPDQ